jgi:4'-phosphopantetheinyl transferase
MPLVRDHAVSVRGNAVRLDEPAGAGNRSAPNALPSPSAEVAVWMCELARPADEIRALATTLSPAERARAARFGRPDLRDRYVVGRATLRMLLGKRLGRAPAEVEIRRGTRGRPNVADAGTLDFNVSHTDGVAIFGFTEDHRIGVDIEHGERRLNVDGIARKFMAPGEQAALDRLAPDERRRALLRLWTCKEAMSKATGDAMSAPFRRISIDIHRELRLVAGPPPYTPGAWRLMPIAIVGGYLATVALWHGVGPPAA